jgi:hypothetical protein
MPPKRKRSHVQTEEEKLPRKSARVSKKKTVSSRQKAEKKMPEEQKIDVKEDIPDGPDDDSEADEEDDERKIAVDVNKLSYKIKIPMWAKKLKGSQTIPTRSYTKAQRKTNMHMTNKAGGVPGSGKKVPPMHKDWPSDEFDQDMSFGVFLNVLTANKRVREIMKWETDFESTFKQNLKVSGEHSPHFGKNLQWKSWSAMLQLELTYPDTMDGCQSWETCFEIMWKRYLSQGHDFNVYKRHLGDLNDLIHYVWQDSGVVDAVSVRTLVRNKILKHFEPVFKRSIPVADREKEWNLLVRSGPLQLPDNVAARLRSEGEAVVTKALKKPQTIHESTISDGVRRLVESIWGESMDTTQPVDLSEGKKKKLAGLTDKAKAVCCLLELLCGSRMIGLMFVNWFDRVHTATMEEWERDNLPTAFGSLTRCIKVTRLSKEGTRAARGEKLRTKGEGDLAVQDRVIIKPLNTMFLDRVFLAPERGFSRVLTEEKNAVTIFLHLIQVLREYIFKERGQKHGLESMQRDGVFGLTESQAEQLPKKGRVWLGGLERQVAFFARKMFPGMFKKNQGTHLLRKIYMIWSYNAFAKKNMKETGYASAVLGHRGFKVSLNYTSLLIEPSVSGEEPKDQTVMEAVDNLKKEVVFLRQQQENLAKKVNIEPESNVVLFDVEGGLTVAIEKLPRAKRNTSEEEHQRRRKEKYEELKRMTIPITYENLAKVGVYGLIKNMKA